MAFAGREDMVQQQTDDSRDPLLSTYQVSKPGDLFRLLLVAKIKLFTFPNHLWRFYDTDQQPTLLGFT